VPQNTDDNAPDLIESIDSLLEEIEETTKTYAPKEEQVFDPNALITDDGTIAPQPEIDSPEIQSPESESVENQTETESEPTDTAQDALEAIEEVETQAEDLVAQSIEALLDEAESVVEDEIAQESESVDVDPEPETPEDIIPEEAVKETAEATSAETDPEADPEELLTSIDQLLESSDDQDEPKPQSDLVADDLLTDSAESEPDEEPVEAESVAKTESPPNESVQTESIQEAETGDAFDDSMDMLDSALAEAADDMLDGDFETEDGELVSGEAVASAIEEALEVQAKPESEDQDDDKNEPGTLPDSLAGLADELLSPADTAEDSNESEASSPSTTQPTANDTPIQEPEAKPVDESAEKPAEQTIDPAPKDTPAVASETTPTTPALDPDVQSEIDALENQDATESIPIPAWFERCVEVARPRIDKIDPFKGKTMDALAMAMGTAIVMVITHATPLLARGTILLSKPLAKQSPEVRNAIGFVALWTGFLGVVLWSYLLLFRTPTTPQPEVAPTRVISAEESLIVNPAINVLP